MLARRALLKLVGAVPAIAAGAQSALAEQLASPAVAETFGMAATAASVGQPVGQANGLSELIYKQLKRTHDQTEREWNIRQRIAPIDPDIAVLRSTSVGHKFRKQLERDLETSSLLAKARTTMWGD